MSPRAAVGRTVAVLQLAGCAEESPDRQEPDVVDTISVTSTAFTDGAAIPSQYTCEGANVSPPLAWAGVPADAAALALVVDDPDAPSGTFTHWVVLDIPVVSTGVAEDAVPAGAPQARNSADRASYFGPCPPGGTHHYRFTVYALSATTGLPDGATLDAALRAVSDLAIARGRLVGTFTRG